MVICKESDCEKRALYNYKGLKQLYCKFHKKDDMINVVDKKCIACKEKHPYFNYENENKAEYCNDCKLDDMINVKDKKCIVCNNKQSCFNYENEKKRLYCTDCKLDGMIDVKNKKCIECNIKRPNFNYENKKNGLYCNNCKLDGMIDVVSKKCIVCNIKIPCFNYENEKNRLYCNDCKLDDMVNVVNKKCIICNIKIPCFNYENEKNGLYCNDCKLDDMVNVVNKKCILCNDIYVSNKYKNHCLRCFIYTFPDNKISRNYKVKERHVQDFLEEEFTNEFIYDKPIDQGCSKKRPDAFKDCLTHTLIIEIDEYQHRSYEEICENKRMMEIYGDINYRPIVFIRFNPDEYIDKNNIKIESSFNMHKTRDVPIIKDPLEWQDRLDKLKKTIEHHIDNVPEIAVTIEKLFYDVIIK
jgi:uncharacterized protein YajQ (UPF0234 family)